MTTISANSADAPLNPGAPFGVGRPPGLILLVSGSTRSLREAIPRHPGRLGFLLTPAMGNSIASIEALGIPWAADNAAYSKWDTDAFARMLHRLQGVHTCQWVAAPDVVGDARATLAQYHWWALLIRKHQQKVAFVGQDGIEDLSIPWADLDTYFVGGTDNWKLSRASADVVAEARRQGKWVHMGRVNSLTRLRVAHDWGCDSVDGTSMSMFGDTYIQRYAAFIEGLYGQRQLFPEEDCTRCTKVT